MPGAVLNTPIRPYSMVFIKAQGQLYLYLLPMFLTSFLVLSYNVHVGLSRGFFSSRDFRIEIVYAFLVSRACATCSVHLIIDPATQTLECHVQATQYG